MDINKKDKLLTFVSAAALLGLFSVANGQVVHADTINGQQVANNTQNANTATNQVVNTNNTNTPQADQTAVNATDQTVTTDNNSASNTSAASDTNAADRTQLNSDAQMVLTEANIDADSLTQDQVVEINRIDFDGSNPDGSTKWTYAQYAGVAKKMIDQDQNSRVPYFNAKKIKNMPATHTRDAQTGKKAKLEIWDSWPVQDAKTSQVVNYKGYQLMIAMMGIPKRSDAHIYLLYNKYNDNSLKHWRCAGPIFGFGANSTNQEWSGSATVNQDGTIQLFYTDVDTSRGDNHQKISTVNLKLKVDKKKNKITIAKRSNRHVLFEGDGLYYQTYRQWKATNEGADNIAMRDAHVISVGGKRYLAFEASTGTINYQGHDSIYNWQNYGGTSKEAMQNFLKITADEDMTSRAGWANAAIGFLELDDNESNPQVAQVLPPLVTSLMVSDEIERPNIIHLNGKYYLFATTRLNRGTGDDLWKKAKNEVGDNVAMLGWVSDYVDHGYQPLNGDSAVLVASVPFKWRTSTYSYYAVPVKGRSDELLVTAYMTNRGFAAGKGKRSTMAPAFIIQVDGDRTSVIQSATNQGDWVYDKKSVNDKMLAKNIKGAHLKGEPIKRSKLKKA